MNRRDELTGYEEHLRDTATREDYNREAYGDPCPAHKHFLRYGGDCPYCEDEAAMEPPFDTLEEKAGDK